MKIRKVRVLLYRLNKLFYIKYSSTDSRGILSMYAEQYMILFQCKWRGRIDAFYQIVQIVFPDLYKPGKIFSLKRGKNSFTGSPEECSNVLAEQ